MTERGMKGTPEQFAERPGSPVIRIYPHPPFNAGLVESRLEEHPQVLEACALQVREKDGRRRLLAHVVTRNMSAWVKMQEELKEWLRATLPKHMIPYRIHRKRELPVLPSGLVDRRRIALRRKMSRQEQVSKKNGNLPAIREPWNGWKFEGVVTAWERRGNYWLVELGHRPARPKGVGMAERLSIRVPPRFKARVRLGERLAVRGRFYNGGWLLAEEVHVVPRITRIGLENHVRVLEAAASG